MGVDMVVVIISLDEHSVSSDGRMFFLTMEWIFLVQHKKEREAVFLTSFPMHLMFISLLCFPPL